MWVRHNNSSMENEKEILINHLFKTLKNISKQRNWLSKNYKLDNIHQARNFENSSLFELGNID